MLLVQLKSADVACENATLRTSPSSGQAATSSQLRHPKLLACHSRAALGVVKHVLPYWTHRKSNMTDYFDEKAQQVQPDSFAAFGIEIISRNGKADEIVQMINFARLAALSDVAHYVKEVFYDSKACICTFKLTEAVVDGDAVATELRRAAKESIAQFDWFGYVDHGNNFA